MGMPSCLPSRDYLWGVFLACFSPWYLTLDLPPLMDMPTHTFCVMKCLIRVGLVYVVSSYTFADPRGVLYLTIRHRRHGHAESDFVCDAFFGCLSMRCLTHMLIRHRCHGHAVTELGSNKLHCAFILLLLPPDTSDVCHFAH